MVNNDAKIGALHIDVRLNVNYDTMQTCLRLLELYLNQNDLDVLTINCDEPGNWDLSIRSRIDEDWINK